MLDLLLLGSLHVHPMSGYELKKKVASTYGVNVSFGTLFPRLASLQKSRLISCKVLNEGRKKIFAPTNIGTEIFQENLEDLKRVMDNLNGSLNSKLAGQKY